MDGENSPSIFLLIHRRVTEVAEKELLRKELGMAAYAILNQPRIDAALQNNDVVADGLYSWSEYKVLRDYYGDRLNVVAVYAPPAVRYERLEKRQLLKEDVNLRNRPATKDQAKARDYAEIENIEKGGPIAMAASGSQWTPCVTSARSRRYGTPARRRGRCGRSSEF